MAASAGDLQKIYWLNSLQPKWPEMPTTHCPNIEGPALYLDHQKQTRSCPLHPNTLPFLQRRLLFLLPRVWSLLLTKGRNPLCDAAAIN